MHKFLQHLNIALAFSNPLEISMEYDLFSFREALASWGGEGRLDPYILCLYSEAPSARSAAIPVQKIVDVGRIHGGSRNEYTVDERIELVPKTRIDDYLIFCGVVIQELHYVNLFQPIVVSIGPRGWNS